MGISVVNYPQAAKISTILVDANLDMGAHDIAIDALGLIDGKDVSELAKMTGGTDTGTNAEQTIAHSLGAIPTFVSLAWGENVGAGSLLNLSTAPDNTNIYVYASAKLYYWYAMV